MSIIIARKKPVTIASIQFTGENMSEIQGWFEASGDSRVLKVELNGKVQTLLIPTLEGTMAASKNDFIIKGVEGEFYPCKPDIFLKTYDIIT